MFLSAVILLHQVSDVSEYQKWTAQSQSDSSADNILLRTFIYNSPKAYSKRSVLGLACESTSGLLPACLSVCPGSACCLGCPLILGRLFFEPQKPHDNRNHDNRTLRQVTTEVRYEYG